MTKCTSESLFFQGKQNRKIMLDFGGGTINKVEELASTLQVAFDAGAKRILIPMSSAVDIPTVPTDLFAKFQISFYSSPEDAVIKALGIE